MTAHIQPTLQSERIEILDILRGIAILGVMLGNMLIFSGYFYTPFEALAAMDFAELNSTVVQGIFLFVSGKFYPMFIMLFGAGFYLQRHRYDESNGSFSLYYLRRLLLLLLIGLVHHAIWPGDVILSYAIFGILLIPLNNIQPRTLLILALSSFAISAAIGVYDTLMAAGVEDTTEYKAIFQFPGIEPKELIRAVQEDGLDGIYLLNSNLYEFIWSFGRMKIVSFQMIGLLLLGSYFMSINFFTVHASKLKLIALFLIAGFAGSYLNKNVSSVFRYNEALFFSLTYVGLICLFYKSKFGQRTLQIFAMVGKLSLTNYILQTILALTVFYGFGFGLFGKTPMVIVYVIAVLIIFFEILFSYFWMNSFQFGPLEWVWRKIIYKEYFKSK